MLRFLVGLLVVLVLYIVCYTVNSARLARKVKEYGGVPAVDYPKPWWDFFGVTFVRDGLVAGKEYRFPEMLHERLERLRAFTGKVISSYRFKILGTEVIFTVDPKAVQAILATQFHDFELGSTRAKAFWPLLREGIFSSNGEAWAHSRALMRPSFARERVSDLDTEDRHTSNLMTVLPVDASGWTSEVDLQVLFFRLTMDSATEFLFGESVLSQLNEQAGKSKKSATANDEIIFARSFDTAQRYLGIRGRVQDMYWIVYNFEFRKACQDCHQFIDRYVNLALSKHSGRKDLSEIKEKGQYVFLEELAEKTQDPIELRSHLLHTLLAGRDTTASLLGWLFFLLARDETAYHRLRTAIINDFGEKYNAEGMTFARLKDCRHLQNCLKEALRLYPVVPVNVRAASKDTTLPTGGGPDGTQKLFVKKGQDVLYSVYVMHRDKKLWGPDADEFKPDRWDSRKQDFSYIPFNAGPRLCLGQQFALTSAAYATVRMLQRFDRLENLDPVLEAKQNANLTTCSANGVRVRLHEAI